MDTIAIIFRYENITVKGRFIKTTAEDGTVSYDLYIGNYLYGRLFNTGKKGWIFSSDRGLFEEKQYVDLFVSTIEAWKN